MRHANPLEISAVLANLHAAEVEPEGKSIRRPAPFVTISRQAGAGGRSLAGALAERLNALDPAPASRDDPPRLPWTVWDNELVERVAAECRIPAARVAALEDERPSWLESALTSLTTAGSPDELMVYHRVATVIRSLASMGRVIIVGRGSGFITADMPGGVHVRLVAPLSDRIAATSRARRITPDAASAIVRELDHNRESFYRRHWPGRPLSPENFTVTFNSSAAAIARIVECIVPLIGHATKAVPDAQRTAATTHA